jgi:hypothetical protein
MVGLFVFQGGAKHFNFEVFHVLNQCLCIAVDINVPKLRKRAPPQPQHRHTREGGYPARLQKGRTYFDDGFPPARE